MELYLRMTASYPQLNELYRSVLVQSMQYFWPDITSMVVVLDNEKSVDHEFGNAINKTFPFPRICFMDDVKILSGRDKDRMQRDLFTLICAHRKSTSRLWIQTQCLYQEWYPRCSLMVVNLS